MRRAGLTNQPIRRGFKCGWQFRRPPYRSVHEFVLTLHLECTSNQVMATAFSRLGFATLRHSCRIQCRRKQWRGLSERRPFHSSPPAYRARSDEDDDSGQKNVPKEPYSFDYDQLDPEERHHYDLLSPQEKKQFQDEERAAYEHLTSPHMESKLQGMVNQAVYDISQETPREQFVIPKITPGLMAMGEDDEQDSGEDEDFEGDDITSIAHGELEQQRELREYARIAAWEMPMLSSTFFFRPAFCMDPCNRN